MSASAWIKSIPGVMPMCRRLFPGRGKAYSPAELRRLSTPELLALMRHESHRIEKAAYNNVLEAKRHAYSAKRDRLAEIYGILEARGFPMEEPTVEWSRRIHDAFSNLREEFIAKFGDSPKPLDPSAVLPFVEFLKSRRSVRVWAKEQPDGKTLRDVARLMIDAARWAPNSGNRQAWRFLVISDPAEKALLEKIKERHCTSAPLLIFMGMDKRVYGALGKDERGLFIDAGAAAMSMMLTAEKCGLGACWNHFADDLIRSRWPNRRIYRRFASALEIEDHIAPVALLAVGAPEFLPPQPARMAIDDLLLRPIR